LKTILRRASLIVVSLLLVFCVSHGQTREDAKAGTADGEGIQINNPALTGVRHPLYRLRISDVLEIHFTFAPEYDQTLTIQPDGFINLRAAGHLQAKELTLPEVTAAIAQKYSFMRDPEVSVTLKDFEKPYFLVGGQVGHPGKYEFRSSTTVTEAIAIAGGFTEQSKHSQVVLFRKAHQGFVESHVLDLKAMLASRRLEEDLELRPGDMLFVPQNRISKIRKFLPVASLSTFFTPAQF